MKTRKQFVEVYDYVRGEWNETAPVTVDQFLKLINNPEYIIIRDWKYFEDRFVRFKKTDGTLVNRSHNIDIDFKNREIVYEGRNSKLLEVVSENDSDFDMLVEKLNAIVSDNREYN